MDVRLTAPDGYRAQRSYSIASGPGGDAVELTVDLVEGGEVSPWFHEVAVVGDSFEIRGPIGGPFTWTPDLGGPLLLVGGGSGVVPLMSMLRHGSIGAQSKALLVYSARSADDLIYRAELEELAADPSSVEVVPTLTRSQPVGWTGYDRRVDAEMLADVIGRVDDPAWTYVCGPTTFVETVAAALVALDVAPARIRTERFGPSG